MGVLLLVAVALLAVTTGLHCLSCLIAAWRQSSNRVGRITTEPLSVTIIRPLSGIEAFSAEALQSTYELNDPVEKVIFCVKSPHDPVIPLVHDVIARNPGVPSALLTGDDPISQNPKLNNMVKGWHAATTPWVAFIDSNVVLPRDALQRLQSRLAGDVGLVCSPPAGTRPTGFAAQIESAFLNTYQARWQSTADWIHFGFAQGKVLFFQKSMLEAAGGIEVLGREPAEDAAATKVVRAAGLRVAVVDQFFQQPLGTRSFEHVWNRQVRWARLRRASFPLYFCVEILSGPVVPVLLAATICNSTGTPVVLALATLLTGWYGLEWLVARLARWPSNLLSFLCRDLLLPCIWISGWLSNDFVWQGNEMRATRTGFANAGK